MNTKHLLLTLGAAVWMLASPAFAHEEETPAAANESASPRFALVSDAFELVGILNGKDLDLYLDHYGDGSPVKDARLELTLAGAKLALEPQGEGAFEAHLEQEPAAGVLPLAATVTTDAGTETLVGEFDLHDLHEDDDEEAGEAKHEHDPVEYVVWGGGALAALLILIFLSRRLRAARHSRSGGAA
ncbi:MAG: hypothetical protein LBQ81_08775 [Zoogloeaceae bacterium]|jgi:hypothetical protein|nr:hypothetical protein [Zoogloeaceae bacterium]